MRKNILAGAIAVAMLGLAAGQASANSQTIPVGPGIGDVTGTGNVLVYPFWVVENYQSADYTSKIFVTNTDRSHSVVARIVPRSGLASSHLPDYILYLSPGDTWVGEFRLNSDGVAVLTSSDDSIYDVHQDQWTSEASPFESVPLADYASYNWADELAEMEAHCGGQQDICFGHVEVYELYRRDTAQNPGVDKEDIRDEVIADLRDGVLPDGWTSVNQYNLTGSMQFNNEAGQGEGGSGGGAMEMKAVALAADTSSVNPTRYFQIGQIVGLNELGLNELGKIYVSLAKHTMGGTYDVSGGEDNFAQITFPAKYTWDQEFIPEGDAPEIYYADVWLENFEELTPEVRPDDFSHPAVEIPLLPIPWEVNLIGMNQIRTVAQVQSNSSYAEAWVGLDMVGEGGTPDLAYPMTAYMFKFSEGRGKIVPMTWSVGDYNMYNVLLENNDELSNLYSNCETPQTCDFHDLFNEIQDPLGYSDGQGGTALKAVTPEL